MEKFLLNFIEKKDFFRKNSIIEGMQITFLKIHIIIYNYFLEQSASDIIAEAWSILKKYNHIDFTFN